MNAKEIYIKITISLFLILVVAAFNTFDVEELTITDCKFKSLTGLSCPTCGITRSIHSAANFNFIDSILYNPIGLIIYALIIFVVLKNLLEAVTRNKYKINLSIIKSKVFIYRVFGAWSIFWIARMIIE